MSSTKSGGGSPTSNSSGEEGACTGPISAWEATRETVRRIREAIRMLRHHPAVRIVRVSRLYRSEPVGTPRPALVRQRGVRNRHGPSPRDLAAVLRRIESALGKAVAFPNGPRTIDLDLLMFDDQAAFIPRSRRPPSSVQGPALRPRAAGRGGARCGRSRLRGNHRRPPPPLSGPIGRGGRLRAAFHRHRGPIGVGKTSLAHLLAEHFNARVVLDPADDNPFLEEFYRDQAKNALQAQLHFLLARFHQQAEFKQPDLFNRAVISDYIFAKDKIFAYQTLGDHDLGLYEEIFTILDRESVRPDLVIYLQAATETLWKRIRLRNRPSEREISREYLGRTSTRPITTFSSIIPTPPARDPNDGNRFRQPEGRPDDLLKQIRQMRRGTQYYVPMSSGENPPDKS